MSETKQSNSVYPKLLEVRKKVTYLQKQAKGGQYDYVSSSQVLASVRTAMDEQGLLLLAAIVDYHVTAYDSKGRNSFFTELNMSMTWVDAETGDEVSLPWYAQGVDLAGEKGVGKALTYAEKYFLLKQFNIATDKDDPDAFQQAHETAEQKQATRDELIAELKVVDDVKRVTEIWANNPDLKKDKAFAAAVKAAGTRLKPKEEPKPAAPPADDPTSASTAPDGAA